MILTRMGQREESALLGEGARGAYRLEPFSAADVAGAVSVTERYPDLEVGLVDDSVVALANRYDTRDLLTLDERDFRVLRGCASARSGSCRPTPSSAPGSVTRGPARTRI